MNEFYVPADTFMFVIKVTTSNQEEKEMTEEELQQNLKELQEELFNLRFQISTGQAGNPLRMRMIRKDVARIKTFMHERANQKN